MTHPSPLRFHATLYQCPETANEREEMSVAVNNRINDLNSVLRTTEDHSVIQLQEIAQELDTWKTKVLAVQWVVCTCFMWPFIGYVLLGGLYIGCCCMYYRLEWVSCDVGVI